MNICFYCDSIFSFGGVQRVLAVIAKALSVSHRVTILTMDHPSTEDTTMYGLSETHLTYLYIRTRPLTWYEYLPCKSYSFLYKKILPKNAFTSYWYGYSSFPVSQRRQLIEKLNESEYDIIIGVHAFLSIPLAAIRHQLHARQVIGWMHNSYQAFFHNRPAYLKGLKEYFRYQMKRLDNVVVLTHNDAQLYKTHLGLCPTVIYNPLTLKPEGRSNPTARKFLAVGRFSARHKGFDILIEGFARFAQHNSEWTLDIVGEGPEETMLRQLIARHSLEERIHIHPFTKNIQTYYASASAYVLSSRWEGFGLVLIEAMAHGLPIISSDIPASRELLGAAPFCFFFKNEDPDSLMQQMVHLATHESQLPQWSEEALKEIEKYSLESTVRQWDALFKTYS